MKKITLLLLFMSTLWSYAQVNSYSFTKSTTTYTEITGGFSLGSTTTDEQRFTDPAVLVGSNTNTGPGLPIGFNFTYNGFVYDKLGVNANGWISLGTSTLNPSVDMTSTDSTKPLNTYETLTSTQLVARIAPFGVNLVAQTGATLRYQTTGNAPNRILTVQWKNYALKSTAGSKSSFQIKLYETSNLIRFVYGLFTAYPVPAANNPNVMVGLRAEPDTALYNFVNRTSTAGWDSTTAGTDVSDAVTTNSTYLPADGLTFTWTPPACGGPANFNAVDITTSGATINWGSFLPPPAGYQYVYATSPTLPVGAGTNVSQPTATLSGLTANTLYYVFLRSNCGSKFTPWILAGNFRTYCNDNTFIIENFDSNLIPTDVPAPIPMIPDCWTKIGNVRIVYKPTSPVSAPQNLQLHVNNGEVAFAILPPLSNLQAGTYRLRFKAWGSNSSKTVDIGYLTDTDDENSFISLDTKALSTGFAEYITLPASIPAGIRFLAFRNSSAASGTGDVFIDDVVWELNPTCPDVKDIVANGATDKTVNLAWTAGDSETAWQYAYAPATVINPNTLTGTTIQENPTIVGGLTPFTSYKIWVRSKCGDALGAWIGPALFATTCSPKTTLSESFDAPLSAGHALPDCWVKLGTSGTASQSNYSMAETPPSALYTFGPVVVALPPLSNAGAGTHRLRLKIKTPTTIGDMLDIGYLTDPGDAGSFVSVTTFISTQKTAFESFEAVLGTEPTINLAFRNNAATTIYIEDVVWEPITDCPPVTGLASTVVKSTSAAFAWASDGNTKWQYAYGLSTLSDLSTLTPVDTDTPSASIIDKLDPSTSYKIWVRTKCDNALGPWEAIPFKTTCTPVTEFEQNFDASGAFAPCWGQVGNALGTSPSPTPGAPSSPNTLYMSSNTANIVVAMKPVSNAGAGTHRLRFKFKGTAVDTPIEVGYLPNSNDPDTFVALKTYHATSGSTYDDITAEFGVNPNISEVLAFRKTAGTTVASIDDVVWEPILFRCPDVTGLAAVGVRSKSASFAWDTDGGSALWEWQYAYGPASVTDPATLTIVNITTPTVSIDKLNPSTLYKIWVRRYCDSQQSGTWTELLFQTNCPPVTEFQQNFDASLNFDSCWTKPGSYGTAKPEIIGDAPSQPNALLMNNTVYNTVVAMTPVSNAGAGTHRLKFKYEIIIYNTQDPGNLELGYLKNPIDPDTFVALKVYSPTPTASYTDITAEFGINPNITEVLAFRKAGGPFTYKVDDVVWEPVLGCPGVTNLNVSDITKNSAAISWTAPASAPENGYDYYISTTVTYPDAYAEPAGSVGAGITNAALSLAPDTTYYIWVRSSCSAAHSPWSGPVTFSTTSLAVKDFIDAELAAYPNPVTDILNLSGDMEISDITLFNLLGQQVIVKSVNANQTQIDMSGLPKGAYLLKVNALNQTSTLKVIKE